MHIIRVPALKNNYIWMILNYTNECIVIDPGESIKILRILKRFQLILKAILLTHNHNDHTNGVNKLIKYFPKTIIYGPLETEKIGTKIIVSEGDDLILLSKKIKVFSLPGHTKTHIGFYYNSSLFCGDTVFSIGCGKTHATLIQQMYKSFLKIQSFPDNTLIHSGHEYTISNIDFAISILPDNQAIINYHNKIMKLQMHGRTIMPTTLELELKINPFFRCNHIDIKRALNFFPKSGEEWKVFRELRTKKDLFNNKTTNKQLKKIYSY